MKIRIEQSQKVEEKSALVLTSIDGLAGRLINHMRGKSPTISHTHFFVDLQVELTNGEKAIIHQYNLGDIVIEEYIDHTLPNQLIEEFNATPPFDQKKRASLQYRINLFSEPIKLTLSQFVDEKGFHRGHDSLREAIDYAQHLKTKILPQIKNTIEHYSLTGGASSDTFEL